MEDRSMKKVLNSIIQIIIFMGSRIFLMQKMIHLQMKMYIFLRHHFSISGHKQKILHTRDMDMPTFTN